LELEIKEKEIRLTEYRIKSKAYDDKLKYRIIELKSIVKLDAASLKEK